MAKKTPSHSQPPATELVIPREQFKLVLEERVKIGKEILDEKIQDQKSFDENIQKYYLWNDYNSEYLKQSFNNEYNEYKSSYDTCADWVGFRGLILRPETPQEKLGDHKMTVEKKLENLNKLISKTDLLKSAVKSTIDSHENMTQESPKMSNEIFIVHGHDERLKVEVARTLEKLGLIPIILSEQANQGQTVIEKFEFHADVGFAVILLTGDDFGKLKTDTEDKYRARQNVILEMGYFIGKLGRRNVFPLYESGVELPSDLHGILYVPIDASGGWKFKLARELKAAGFDVDANEII